MKSIKLSQKITIPIFLTLVLLTNVIVLSNSRITHLFGFIPFATFLLLPGFLILRLLTTSKLLATVIIALSVCLSLSVLIIGGLLINILLPILNVHRPLDTHPLILAFNILIIILIYTLANKKKLNFNVSLPSKRTLVSASVIALLPLAAAAGAIHLNNGGSNIIIMLVILIIACILILSVVLNDTKKLYPFIIYFISLSLLLLWSLRSYYLPNAADIGTENYVFNLTFTNAHWSINLFRNAYNACLSVTILPTIFAKVTHYSGTWIYKFWYPAIFSLLPSMLYVYARKLFNYQIAFFASVFFSTQTIFIYWMPMLARQEIAVLFFGALLLCIFGLNKVEHRSRNILRIVLFTSLILSHYSTAYIALFVIAMGIIVRLIIERWHVFGYKIKNIYQYTPSLLFLSTMLLITFLWQIQITSTGKGLVSVLGNTVATITGSDKNTAKNVSASKLFSINPLNAKTKNTQSNLYDYESNSKKLASKERQKYYNDANNYSNNTQLTSLPEVDGTNNFLTSLVSTTNTLVSLILRLSLLIGLLVIAKYRKQKYVFYIGCALGFLIALTAIVIFPYISTEYNVERLYQTALILLAPAIVIGLTFIFMPAKHFRRLYILLPLTIILLFFFYNTGLMTQIGGGTPSAILNNYGYNYDLNYTTKTDVKAIEWLKTNRPKRIPLYADSPSSTNLLSYGGISSSNENILPSLITKNSYVYLDRSNYKDKTIFQSYNGTGFTYVTPLNFLNSHKNRIYVNKDNAIYE